MKLRLLAASLAAVGMMAGSARAELDVAVGQELFDLYAAGDVITNMQAKVVAADHVGGDGATLVVGDWSSGANDLSAVAGSDDHYLALDTEGDVVTNALLQAQMLSEILDNDVENYVDPNTGDTPNGEVFLMSTITFVPSDEIEDTLEEGAEINNGDLKFALYAYEHEVTESVDDGEGNFTDVTSLVTNLVVYHSFYDSESNHIYTNDVVSTAIEFDQTQEVIVTMKRIPQSSETYFKVSVGSQEVTSPLAYSSWNCAAAMGATTPDGGAWFRTVNNDSAQNISSINFSGTGGVHNLAVGYNTASAASDFAVDWTGSQNVVVTNMTAGGEVSGTSGDFAPNTVLTFYPTVGTITNVAGEAVANLPSFALTVTEATNIVVLAGEEPPAPTVITVTAVGNATVTDNQDGTYTVAVDSGSTLSSVFVNGAAIDPALVTDNQDGTYDIDLSGLTTSANVVVATKKVRTPIGHKWYENPGAIATNVVGKGGDAGPWHFQIGNNYAAISFGNHNAKGSGFSLFDVDALLVGGASAIYTENVTNTSSLNISSMRGAAICEALDVALTCAYSGGKAYAFPLATNSLVLGETVFEITNDQGYTFDRAYFTADGQYLYTTESAGGSTSKIAKWNILNGLKTSGVNLTLVEEYTLPDRVRDFAYARIGKKDLLYVLRDGTAGVCVYDVSAGTTTQLTAAFAMNGNYGSVAVSMTDTTTPTLTVYPSVGNTTDPLSVYQLASDGLSISSTLATFTAADLTAAGVAQGSYMRCAIPSDDDEILYIGLGGDNLYVLQYVEPPTPTYTVDWTGSDKVSVTNLTEGASLDEVTSGDFTNGVQIAFFPNEGSITNVLVAGQPQPFASPFVLTVVSDTNLVVYAGETAQAEKPAWAADSGDGSDQDKYWDWAEAHAAGQDLYAAGADYSKQYLLNVDANVTPTLHIDSVEVTDEGTKIVVSAEAGSAAINLATINGYLDVYVGDVLGSLTKKAIPDNNIEIANNVATIIIPVADGKFVKAGVDYAEPDSSITDIGE